MNIERFLKEFNILDEAKERATCSRVQHNEVFTVKASRALHARRVPMPSSLQKLTTCDFRELIRNTEYHTYSIQG